MAEINSFSKGLDVVLEALRPYNNQAGESSFPPFVKLNDMRRRKGEPLRQWFENVTKTICKGNPERIAMEENIAVLAKVRWRENKRLIYANIQVLVCSDDLVSYLLENDQQATYLRLDCDYQTLGTPFSHPLPHIHVEGDLSPRFSLDGGISENVIIDFFEFVYRHFVPDAWLRWSEKVWDETFSSTNQVPFQTIKDAFENNQFQVLRSYAAQLTKFKRALRKAKDERIGFDLRLDATDREILEYPLAR